MQLQLTGQFQMQAAIGTGRGQRMFQHRKQHLGGQPLAEKPGHMAQIAAGSGQGKWPPCGIVRQDAPAIKGCGDLSGQAAVRCDQGGGPAILRRFAQDQGNGQGFGPWRCCLYQGHVFGGESEIGQLLSVGQPVIRDRRGAQRQGHKRVALWIWRGNVAPELNGGMRQVQRIQQSTKAVLRMIFRRQSRV